MNWALSRTFYTKRAGVCKFKNNWIGLRTDTLKFDAHVPPTMQGEYVIKCYPVIFYGYGYDDQSNQIVTGGMHVKVLKYNETEEDVGVTE